MLNHPFGDRYVLFEMYTVPDHQSYHVSDTRVLRTPYHPPSVSNICSHGAYFTELEACLHDFSRRGSCLDATEHSFPNVRNKSNNDWQAALTQVVAEHGAEHRLLHHMGAIGVRNLLLRIPLKGGGRLMQRAKRSYTPLDFANMAMLMF